MKRILNVLVWGNTSLTNTFEFVKLLEEYQFGHQDKILSFDVESFFTRVPVKESLEIVERRLLQIRELSEDPLKAITSMKNSAIMKVLKLCLGNSYFVWDKTLYLQVNGLPMGGRLSPILANIFMEELEFKVLTSTLFLPKIYFRYVDDIFIVWDDSRGDVGGFLTLMNAQDPNIHLLEEKEKDRCLPFLDVSVKRPLIDCNGKVEDPLEISIYRKKTHADRYVQYISEHPMLMKRDVVHGLVLRAYHILNNYPKQLRKELQHLRTVLQNRNNGYPSTTINRWFTEYKREFQRKPYLLTVNTCLCPEDVFQDRSQQIFKIPEAKDRFPHLGPLPEEMDNEQTELGTEENGLQGTDAGLGMDLDRESSMDFASTQNTQEPDNGAAESNAVLDWAGQCRPTLVIPYVKGLGENLQKIAREANCSTWWKYPGRASDRFAAFKGQIHQSKAMNMVYCTECECGLKCIGESSRNLKVRLHEHLHGSSKSTLSAHFLDHKNLTGHKPAFQNTTVLAREQNSRKRKLTESICIKFKPALLCNSGVSMEMPGAWDVCIPGLVKQLSDPDQNR